MMIPPDTIAALATARGQAALAIVRVSGPAAISIVNERLRGQPLETAASHTAHVAFFVDENGQDVDQVVTTLFRSPRSATGEDIVEITCHGGDFAPQRILRLLLDHGARLAEPGEFTQRAFLNGKLDLAQAEAVADLIHASSSRAHHTSLAHLQGQYSEALQRLRAELLQACALIELELDFSEEDVEFADKAQLEELLSHTAKLLTELVDSYRLGALLRDGVRAVIAGRPNAGKSTLLNALVGEDRAIVSPVPGTTRDTIEAEVEIGGLRFQFLDTAGLRLTDDLIEAEGVRRTERAMEHSDVLLYVYDLTEGLLERDTRTLARLAKGAGTIILVGNKADLVASETAPPELFGFRTVGLSALDAQTQPSELAFLRRLLINAVAGDLSQAEASRVVTNQRHRQHLQKALLAVRTAQTALQAEAHGDTLALDLRQALHELGAITGEITNEDILGEIFSNFCIGK